MPYAEDSEKPQAEKKGRSSSLAHPNPFEKAVNAADRVITEPRPYTRATLAALAGMNLDVYPIGDVVKLPLGEMPNWNQRLSLVRMARTATSEGNMIGAMGFNALANIGPTEDNSTFVDPADITLDPYYDSRHSFTVDLPTAKAERLHNGG